MKQQTSLSPTQMRDVPCLILAGGMGTRLRPVLDDMPKPMAPVAGRPFLEYLVRWLREAGVGNVTLCVGYRADQIRKHFEDGAGLGIRIHYSRETEPLGTWGAIRLGAENLVADHFLVLNGDSWLQVDLRRLVDLHMRMRSVATIAAAEMVGGVSRFGCIQVDARGRVVDFFEKQDKNVSLINGGVYMLAREVLKLAPRNASSIEREVFPALVSHGMYALPVRGYFVDIGIPEEYKRLQDDAGNWMQALALSESGASTC